MVGVLWVLEEEVMRGRRDEDENDSLEEYQTSEENEWLKQESKRLNEQNNNSKPKMHWKKSEEEEQRTNGTFLVKKKRKQEDWRRGGRKRTSSQCPHSLLSLLWKVGQCQTMQATPSARNVVHQVSRACRVLGVWRKISRLWLREEGEENLSSARSDGEEEEKEWVKEGGYETEGTFLLSRDKFSLLRRKTTINLGSLLNQARRVQLTHTPTIPSSGFTTITLTKQMNRTEDLAALFLEPSGLTAS
ncbi:hypothetical protein BLNAU_23412 [Blattamonas nauphoetae]|uniref:Uncharacterized protein n=1 Tax=Blattamonas nauphoetae TaxID=2049346 RepID=A0ABQ9WQT1_9EUKA|nr:hypothetical protein BLNAU_23412 [Blattamonas nauphoetae]